MKITNYLFLNSFCKTKFTSTKRQKNKIGTLPIPHPIAKKNFLLGAS